MNSSLEELINIDINTMTIQIAKSPNRVNFSAFMAALLPWVPEAFLAYGGVTIKT